MAGINTTPCVVTIGDSSLNAKLESLRPISPFTQETRNQPPERQHYEKKDTKFNNQQKQKQNKSGKKSNEKWK